MRKEDHLTILGCCDHVRQSRLRDTATLLKLQVTAKQVHGCLVQFSFILIRKVLLMSQAHLL
jgi:hypothetical protein